MSLYAIPVSEVLKNDSGNEIRVISVQPPLNGQVLAGRIQLQANTILYTWPESKPATDYFSYTIEDQYGRNVNAEVTLTLPEDEGGDPTSKPTIINAFALDSIGNNPVSTSVTFDKSIPFDFWKPSISSFLAVMEYGDFPGHVADGWILETSASAAAGKATCKLYKQFFDSNAIDDLRSSLKLPVWITGPGSLYPNAMWSTYLEGNFVDDIATDLIESITVQAIAPGQTSISVPKIPAGHFGSTSIKLFVLSENAYKVPFGLSLADGTVMPAASTFTSGTDGGYAYDAPLDNPINGAEFTGQDYGFAYTVIWRLYP
jgi:hypothetical protein